MVTTSSASTSLKEYLKKYETSAEEEKKKKKKKKVKTDARGVVVVDEDPVWQKPVKIEEEDDESADEEKPQIDEDIEVKRMKRLEQLRSRRPFGVISEDGSGWVSISETPKNYNSGDQEVDMSPPRRRITRNDTPSPDLERRPSSSVNADLSPTRKQRVRNDTPSPDHELYSSSKKDVDLSPPRKRRLQNDSPSPESRTKPSTHNIGDLSPPRQRRKRYQSSASEPEMKSGCNSREMKSNDISPLPRRRPNLEVPKSSREVDDRSPQRRQRHRQLSPSPERRYKTSRAAAIDSDLSPQRVCRSSPRQDDSLASPATDLSPPRRSRKARSPQQPHYPVLDNDVVISDLSPRRRQKEPPVLKQLPKTGIVTGREIKEENTKKKKEELLRFKEMDPSFSGRGAQPVYRDTKTGERMSKEEFLKKKEKDEKPKHQEVEWGKGLAQKREAEVKMKELELEKEKPFARSRDDPELDRMLKERLRWGDPMAHLVKKNPLEPVLPDLGDSDRMKESGFIIPQEIPSHSWIRRGLGAHPNRYGIKPGRHWDGVDRSNGYEKEFYKRMNEKQATEKEAYMWSVADM